MTTTIKHLKEKKERGMVIKSCVSYIFLIFGKYSGASRKILHSLSRSVLKPTVAVNLVSVNCIIGCIEDCDEMES
ncbi:CLUMA_CG008406, isoform A [Clunio marinus]|uniref:CLUMA_CG008406, isoform A n=1 Tax=Clunio marinus TaxID=568069 RepID=A0A1J1I3Z0_9DIPT|nr:CLUMA_CG008406, isoform A [Clunio marinus]